MNICIVSPHLDDALLSCGILMQRRIAMGDTVIIANIFHEGTNAANRRIEEVNAMKPIGATPYFLGELDAPDRNPVYWDSRKLFFGHFDEVPESYIDHIERLLRDFFDTHKIDIAYFPLAAGNHIDHRIAYAVGRRIQDMPVRFYEDRPYILWPGVLQGRMNQIGSDAALPSITEKQMQDSLHDYHYLKHFVPEGEYQDSCLPMYYAALREKSARTLHATPETLIATDAELKKLYEALDLYASQMPLIYDGYDNFIKDSLSYERANSGQDIYAERSWTLT